MILKTGPHRQYHPSDCPSNQSDCRLVTVWVYFGDLNHLGDGPAWTSEPTEPLSWDWIE